MFSMNKLFLFLILCIVFQSGTWCMLPDEYINPCDCTRPQISSDDLKKYDKLRDHLIVLQKRIFDHLQTFDLNWQKIFYPAANRYVLAYRMSYVRQCLDECEMPFSVYHGPNLCDPEHIIIYNPDYEFKITNKNIHIFGLYLAYERIKHILNCNDCFTFLRKVYYGNRFAIDEMNDWDCQPTGDIYEHICSVFNITIFTQEIPDNKLFKTQTFKTTTLEMIQYGTVDEIAACIRSKLQQFLRTIGEQSKLGNEYQQLSSNQNYEHTSPELVNSFLRSMKLILAYKKSEKPEECCKNKKLITEAMIRMHSALYFGHSIADTVLFD